MRRPLLPARASLLLTAALPACSNYNCEDACHQYYGPQEDGSCGRPSVLPSGDVTAEEAEANCNRDCIEAMYTTTSSEIGGEDAANISRLDNEVDAIAFIQCVVEKDYGEAARNQTCDDLQNTCPWFRW